MDWQFFIQHLFSWVAAPIEIVIKILTARIIISLFINFLFITLNVIITDTVDRRIIMTDGPSARLYYACRLVLGFVLQGILYAANMTLWHLNSLRELEYASSNNLTLWLGMAFYWFAALWTLYIVHMKRSAYRKERKERKEY